MQTKHLISVSTTQSRRCQFCDEQINALFFPSGVNHYIQAHGCTLLHIGGHTEEGPDGKPWHGTMATLGSDVVPPVRELPEWMKAMQPPAKAPG